MCDRSQPPIGGLWLNHYIAGPCRRPRGKCDFGVDMIFDPDGAGAVTFFVSRSYNATGNATETPVLPPIIHSTMDAAERSSSSHHLRLHRDDLRDSSKRTFDLDPARYMLSRFGPSDMVQLESGEYRSISQLSVGDRVWSADVRGSTLEPSGVVALLHVPVSEASIPQVSVHVTLESGALITLAPDQLVVLTDALQIESYLVTASQIAPGDVVQSMCFDVGAYNVAVPDEVVSVTMVSEFPVDTYAVLTESPFLLVNGLITLPFADSHVSRALDMAGLPLVGTRSQEGIIAGSALQLVSAANAVFESVVDWMVMHVSL
jgi:hypothetical protein